MGAIQLDDVSKGFGSVRAVDGVSLDIADGEFLVLVGPSGCGKSTLLRLIAGLEEVSGGRILIDGQDATDLPPRSRDIAMVFQNYALYPHMTVAENLGFGLKVRGTSKPEIGERVQKVAEALRLDQLLERKPNALSGGQRQRVAMGRAMVREPATYLMDEPLSNLDAKLRVAMRSELSRLHERLGVTTVYVTHDQIEAMTLGQRVAVMRDGRVQQVDTPQALFHQPANVFVAGFIGSPSINLAEAVHERGVLRFGGLELPLPPNRSLDEGQRVLLGIRPTDFEHAEGVDPALPRISVTAVVVEDLGAESHVVFGVDTPRVEAEHVGSDRAQPDDESRLLAEDEGRSLFTAVLDASRPLRQGDRVSLAVETRRLHIFDARSGAALGPDGAAQATVGEPAVAGSV